MAKKSASPARAASAAAPAFDVQGMILLEYTGRNVGSAQWGGPGSAPTGRTYVFGANTRDRIKYVDERDVAWLLGRRVDGQAVFMHRQTMPKPMEPTEPNEPGMPDEPGLDPRKLTIGQIEGLTLTLDQWAALYESEIAGRNRTGALTAIKEHMEDVPV